MMNSRLAHPTSKRQAADVDAESVLDVLADPDCRAMLEAAAEPRLAKELAEACDLPSSTVYRKIDRLTDADLLKEQTRIDAGGHHASEYVSDVESVTIVPDADGVVDLDVERKEESLAEPASYASFATADD